MTVIDAIKSMLGADPTDRADADMKKVLQTLRSLHPRPLENLTASQARQQPTPADAVKKLLQDMGVNAEAPSGVTSRDITLDGAEGRNPARVYTPDNLTGPLPVILYFHGGGFVIADLDTYDAAPRAMAAKTGAVVVSAHYRQAPEHKFPASHDDAFAAWRWILANASKLGGDPSRIAVLGESAGANLAANVTIYARDHGLPLPIAQGLVYPIADTNSHTLSYEENRNAQPLNKPMMLWFVDQSIEDTADLKDKRLQLVEQDLRDLPPTFVVTAGIDPLRSDGEKLTQALEKAGNLVAARNYAGATHEFFGMASVVQAARDAQMFVAEGFRSAFQAVPPLNGQQALGREANDQQANGRFVRSSAAVDAPFNDDAQRGTNPSGHGEVPVLTPGLKTGADPELSRGLNPTVNPTARGAFANEPEWPADGPLAADRDAGR